MRSKILTIVIAILFPCVLKADFPKACKDALKTVPSNSITYKGQDGWLYLEAELRHLAAGKFWGKAAIEASRCNRADRADPLPAIVDFNSQLKKLGIKLIVVPVPPKLTVYPEGMKNNIKSGQAGKFLKEFYKVLRSKGVGVLDLSDCFIKSKHGRDTFYCRQDSHWSGYGCEIAAEKIAAEIKTMPWYKIAEKSQYFASQKKIEINGDLLKSLKDKSAKKEKISLRFIKGNTVFSSSPVLLMGDSHTLIFHEGGDMFAENAGLIDQLAFDLKMPIDLIAVRGSGATIVRIGLYRKAKDRNWLKNIKVIIWCFAARDFTEASSGWRKVPVKN